MEKRLYRSRTNRVVWGVCGGLGRYFNIDVTLVRILFIISIFLGFTGVLFYLVFAVITPVEPPEQR